MYNKFRIVFVTCSNDPWINDIEDLFIKASKEINIEIIVISSGKKREKNYINLECIDNDIFFEKIKNRTKKNIELPEYIVQRESAYYKASGKGSINDIFNKWDIEASFILRIIQPDIIFVWNGMATIRWVYANSAKELNIPLFFLEKGMFPDSWYIDPYGIGFNSKPAKTKKIENISSFDINDFKNKIEEIDKKGKSAWGQPDRINIKKLKQKLKINNKQKIIFFPGQVDDDTNIVLFSKYFKSTFDALKAVCDSIKNDALFIIAKPHPKGISNINDLNNVISNKGVLISDINIIDAIELSDIIVTINSTVGFEALLRKKPVLFLGDSIVSNKKFTFQYRPGIELNEQIKMCLDDHYKNSSKNYHKALMFGAFLDKKYYLYKKSLDPLKERMHSIIKGRTPKKKNFEQNEIIDIFSEYKNTDIINSFEGRVLLLNALRKLKRKFLKSK